jgi:hypothetical protein
MLPNIPITAVITIMLSLAVLSTPLDWDKIAHGQKFLPMPLNYGGDFHTGIINDKQESYGLSMPHPIHYMFIPCEKNPETAPFLFWSMGGPGASVLSFWYYFNGPLRKSMGGLPRSPYGFNKFANLVVLEYPYGIGFSLESMKKGKGHTPIKHLHLQYKRYLKVLTKFFEKFDSYGKNKIWLGGDSSVGDFLPNVVNVMHDFTTHRDVFDRVVGVINEGPELSGAANLWQMPIGYRMFNLITKEDHRKILKKFKSRAAKLGQKNWQKFFHDFEIALGEKIARPRYSPEVVDYYDIRDFIPFV